MTWVLPFLGLLLLLILILTFSPCLMLLFSKFLQDHLQAFTNWTIHKLLLTHSDYWKLWPHTNPLDPHYSFFLSYPHNDPVWQEAVTGEWPLALTLNQEGWNDRAHMGLQTKNKSQWSVRLTKLPNSILLSHWCLTSQSCKTTRFQTSSYMAIPSENFSLVEYKKDSIRKGEHWFSLRASHPLFYL